MVVTIQIGFSKSFKETQRVNAFINGDKITWKQEDGAYNGTFATPTSSRQSRIWFIARCECNAGDAIKLESSVFITGQGFDEDRSRVVEFFVDETVEPTNYDIKKVGDSNFPLIAGRIVLLHSRTKLQDRHDAADSLVAESQN